MVRKKVDTIKAIRGMHDITPERSAHWAAVERSLQAAFTAYGYQEIRMPIVESTRLFKRSIGEVTDIVEKEMYTFADRNDELMSLRPEGTAGCVRACIERRLLETPQKLWYNGPMFRYERPQKGRQRQFHQIGGEALGYSGVEVEVETLLLHQRFWKALGLQNSVSLQINSIGDSESRAAFKAALILFLEQRKSALDEDSQRRLDSNPLRILDSKNRDTQALLNDAPKLQDYLSEHSAAHFELLRSRLSDLGIAFECNQRLVRGLDYYNDTVFEWVSDELGSQATVCAGGRYDGLVEQLGGKSTPAFGFAMGMERLLLILESQKFEALQLRRDVDIYFIVAQPEFEARAFAIAEAIRDELPELVLQQQLLSGSIKSQFKKADKCNARFAFVLAESEFNDNALTIKNLETGDQQLCELGDTLKDSISSLTALLR